MRLLSWTLRSGARYIPAPLATGAQMDGMEVSGFLSDVACSLSYIFGCRVIFSGSFGIAKSSEATAPP
jgi:hypothetical protein